MPSGAGNAAYFITIDSNGTEVDRELIYSTPDGWMTQKHLNKMPKHQYKPSIGNPDKAPVRVKVVSELKRMN